MSDIEIGPGKRAKAAYSFDDIAIVPSRRTRDPEEVSISWQIDAYKFDLPFLAAPMDSVVSPATAIAIGQAVGHFIGMAIVTVVSLTDSLTTALIGLGAYIVYVQIENYVITPKIMRKSLAIPGLVTIIAALLGASLLGLIGGLLAVPIAAAVLLILDEVVFPRADQS